MTQGPDFAPVSAEAFRVLYVSAGKIAVSGVNVTVEEDSLWTVGADFPHTLKDEIVIGTRGYVYAPYAKNANLDIAARIYGESINSLRESKFPLGYIHVDLIDSKTDDTILGLDYGLFNTQQVARHVRRVQVVDAEQKSAFEKLADELTLNHAIIPDADNILHDIGEPEAKGLVRIIQRVLP